MLDKESFKKFITWPTQEKKRKCPCMRIKEKKIKGKYARETDIEGLQAITPRNLAII